MNTTHRTMAPTHHGQLQFYIFLITTQSQLHGHAILSSIPWYQLQQKHRTHLQSLPPTTTHTKQHQPTPTDYSFLHYCTWFYSNVALLLTVTLPTKFKTWNSLWQISSYGQHCAAPP